MSVRGNKKKPVKKEEIIAIGRLFSSEATKLEDMDQIYHKMSELDEIVCVKGNGCYTVGAEERAPQYKIRQMCEYAKRIGKDTSELTDQELEMFRIE